MNTDSLAKQAAAHDRYFTGMMSQVPTFFSLFDRALLNPKYVRHRDGLVAADYKTGSKSKKTTTMGDDSDDDVEDGSDDDEEGGDANALFHANNQIETPTFDDEDVGFGAPKSYADAEELRRRLIEKRGQLEAMPRLSPEEIAHRKALRKEKDAKDKEKQVKQKSKPSGGHVSANAQQNTDPDGAPQQKKQRQNGSDKKGDEMVQLKMSAPKMLSLHDYSAVQNAGTKHLHKDTAQSRLRQAEQFHEKVQNLKASGQSAEADALVLKKTVDTALARAMGEKVNDNLQSLKKQVKQNQKQKEKSAKQWKRREKDTESGINERQDRRNLHIKKKIDHKRDSRIARKSKA